MGVFVMSLAVLPLIAALIVSNQKVCNEEGVCQTLPDEINGIAPQVIHPGEPAFSSKTLAWDIAPLEIKMIKPDQTWEQRKAILEALPLTEIFFTSSRSPNTVFMFTKSAEGYTLKALEGRYKTWSMTKVGNQVQPSSDAIGRDDVSVVRQVLGVDESFETLWNLLLPVRPNSVRDKQVQQPFATLEFPSTVATYSEWEQQSALALDFPYAIQLSNKQQLNRKPTLVEIKTLNLFETKPSF